MKFQWSIFLNNKDEQVVVRNDDYKEFVADVEAVKKDFTKKYVSATSPSSSTNMVEEQEPSEHEAYWVRLVKKEGSNQGKHFRIGKTSGKFMGFTDEPLS